MAETAPLRRYRATVAYDGTDWAGFQIQADRDTIQGQLESVLERLLTVPIRIAGAGRTDAGVHAWGQVITFQAAWRHEIAKLERGMNALLPASIAVRDLEIAPEAFHARFSATDRTYVYNLSINAGRQPLQERYLYRIGQALDLWAVRAATRMLVGRQDFGAFGQPPSGSNTVREVLAASWYDASEVDARPVWSRPGSDLSLYLMGTAFLRGMVRRIVGTLLQVGIGVIDPLTFGDIVRSGDISRAAPPAPACGLCLWHIGYGPDGRGRRQGKR